MYEFYENFNILNERKLPYSMREEQLHPYSCSPSCYVENGMLKLVRDHARLLFLTPALEKFNFTCKLGYVPPAFVQWEHISWGVYFGYNERLRTGKLLTVNYYESKSELQICLHNLNGNKEQLECIHIEPNVKLEGDCLYNLSLMVEEGKCKVKFDIWEAVFDCSAIKGRIGLVDISSFMGLWVSDVKLESDTVPSREIWKNKYVIPHYDGGSEDYFIDVVLRKYTDGPYEVSYELTGGVNSRFPRDYKMDIWSVQYDVIKNAYIKFYGKPGSDKLYLHNGEMCFVEKSPTWKYTEIEMDGKTMPYKGRFYLEDLDESSDFAFGYEQFRRLGNELQEGGREFLYRNGQLIYSGEALSDEYLIRIQSPEDKRIAEQIPLEIDEYEKALFHARQNHYFLQEEDISFRVHWHAKTNITLLRFRVKLLDAFFEEIQEIEIDAAPSNIFEEFGFRTYISEVHLEQLQQGVYHIKACMLLGEEIICSHTSAFEVMDDSELSPRESSGIPFIYSGEAAPANIKYNCPDPWIIKPDHNEIHYVDCMLAVPEVSEYRKGWELLKLYKRKMFLWLSTRTVPDGKSYLDYPESIKCADYIDVVEQDEPIDYLILTRAFKRPFVRKIYEEYRQEKPELGLLELSDEGMSEADLKKFFDLCGSDWIDYFCEKNAENILKFHEEIRKINPRVKFSHYGPYAIYGTNHSGIRAAKWRMVPPNRAHELMDGFWFFEDYPYITGHVTHYSGWGMMGLLLHMPKARIVVELFGSFDPVCPDGFVFYAYPPMGGCFVESYRTVTQVYEHMYAAVYQNGKFCYYNNPGFQFLQSYNTEASKRFEEFLKGWGVYRKNKPVMPLRAPVYVMDYINEDDRFMFGETEFGVNNISQAGQAYIYSTVAQMGLPKGFCTDFEGLVQLTKEHMDVCVLPSLKHISETTKEKIRKLSASEIGLVAVGDVGELTDLFGVEKCEHKATVCSLQRTEEEEYIACRNAEFFYREKGAKVLLYAVTPEKKKHPVILQYGKNILINCYICQVGVSDFAFESFGLANVSRMFKDTVEDLMRKITSPLAEADGDCGISLFVTTQGEKRILLTDYSFCGYKEEKNIVVQLHFNVENVRFVGHKDHVIEPKLIRKEGKVKGFAVKLRPGESALFAIEENLG